MKIYFFRHAQKAMDFSNDPDLTVEGHTQASKVLDRVLKKELPLPTELWVSPKKRTVSTLKPLAQHLKIPLQVHEDLLEQQSEETLTDFHQRISKVLSGPEASSQAVIFLCTHYDWVVEAMAVVPCDSDLSSSEFAHWMPCQYIGFKVQEDGIFELIELKRIQL